MTPGTILLFPGQGSQSVGMGRDLWERYPVCRDTFAEAEEVLGWELQRLCFEGPLEELTRTDKAQPAIFTCSVATWRALQEHGIDFEVALGHSLGDFGALVATGQLGFAAGLCMVEARGRAMWECGQRDTGTMAAIVGLSDEVVEQLCRETQGAWPANYNCPGQVVISGTPEGVARAGELARAEGAKRVIPLQVSGAFHSPLVAGAAEALRQALTSAALDLPVRGRFFSTTEVRYPETSEVRDVLLAQLTSPVRFTHSLHALLPQCNQALEVGPGGVLAGLVKRTQKDFKVYGTADGEALNAAVQGLSAPRA